jgi:hypothetical protein
MEDWDLVDSLHSSIRNNNSTTPVEKNKNTTTGSTTFPELDFNRFANQPEFEIKDDVDLDEEDYEQQLRDEGVIFCESPPPDMFEDDEFEEEIEQEIEEEEEEEEEEEIEKDVQVEEEINFTLGDSSKLMNNDTTHIFDDVARNIIEENNQLEQQRINQYKNNYLSFLFSPINFNNQPLFLNNMSSENSSSEETTRESQLDKNAKWKKTLAGPSVPYVSNDLPVVEDEEEKKEKMPSK